MHESLLTHIRLRSAATNRVPQVRKDLGHPSNSAGMAVDAIRCAKLARERNIGGPLHEISAVCMKHPPKQFRDSEAHDRLERWIAGQ